MVADTTVLQLTYNFIDPAGTVLDGFALEQIVGLSLGDFASATFNILTSDNFYTGVVTEFDAGAVPVPAALWLFASALGLLGVRRLV